MEYFLPNWFSIICLGKSLQIRFKCSHANLIIRCAYEMIFFCLVIFIYFTFLHPHGGDLKFFIRPILFLGLFFVFVLKTAFDKSKYLCC